MVAKNAKPAAATPATPALVAPVATTTNPAPVTASAPSARTARVWGACLKGNPSAQVLLPNALQGINQASVITINPAYIGVNPKAKASAVRFAKYVNGGTVAQYIAACAGLATPRVCLQDLAWDINHGYIVVTQPAAAANTAQSA